MPHKPNNHFVPNQAFKPDIRHRSIVVGIRESGSEASGEAEDRFGSDGQDECALGVEVEEGFVVDCAVDVEEVDGGPAVGEVSVSGEDLLGGEMVVVDHGADFGREAEEMAWFLAGGNGNVLSVCERHLDLNTV